MEGLGNDYVYVNCFREKVYDPEILARLVSDRHRGIGGDGLILIGPSARADFNMDIYNADGSRAEMCGNGIRCLGKYVYDHGMTEKTEFTVETQAGIKRLRCILQDGRVVAVCVDMGRPDIGAAVEMAVLPDETVDFVRVSMGNPHAVVWVDDIYVCQMETLGPEMEVHPMFPNRTNVEFVQIVDHCRTEEGLAVLQRRLIDDDLCALGLDALHDTLNRALAEVIAVALHRQTVNANHNFFFLALIPAIICFISTSNFKHPIRNKIFTSAVALNDCFNQLARSCLVSLGRQ